MARVRIDNFSKPGYVADTDSVDLAPEAFSAVRNARFNVNGAEACDGEAVVFGTPGTTPLWQKVFPPPDAPIWVYGGLTKVYGYDGSAHTDISRTVGGAYNATANERWQGEVFNGVGIFNQVADDPQMWTSFAVATKLAALSNWPANYKCKSLRAFKNFLFAMHPIEAGIAKPFRVRWSSSAVPGSVPASWDPSDATKDSREVDLAFTDGYVIDGLPMGELFYVYKTDSVYAFQYVGPPDIFGNWQVIAGKGALWRDCIQRIPGGHFVAGVDDIYVHTGQKGSEQSILEASLRKWIFNQISTSNYFNCYTMVYERLNEVWFCFPEAGSTYATKALVWNRLSGGKGIRDLPGAPFASVGPIIPAPGTYTWG